MTILEHVKNHPNDYLREIAVVFNCSDTAIRKALKKLKITRKKDKKYYEQNTELVKEYLEQIKCIDKNKFVYVDETGLDIYFSRKYGRAPQFMVLKEEKNLKE